jgi:O-methyltransferase
MTPGLPAHAAGSASAADRLREIRASPAAPEEAALRTAYLDLLRLSLCDLVGAGTTAVRGLPQGRLVSHELGTGDVHVRAHGRDWPLHALTMTGLIRLDDLQHCVETIVHDSIAGDLIETGSWRGGCSILMRATLDSLGAVDRTVWVADSFQGFPEPDPSPNVGGAGGGYAGSLAPYFAAFDYLAAPLEEVQEAFARLGYVDGVRFVPGFFEQTLPGLAGGERRWSVIRLDGDTYDVTLLALRCLYPSLSPGGYVIVDDYFDIDECRRAVDDFRREHSIDEPLEQVDWSCARWRRTSGRPIEPYAAPAGEAAPPRRAMKRAARRPVPTERELELERQLDELGERLGALNGELARARVIEQRLREVTESTSWRLTRPLRELGLRLRQLRR